jgi:hypothetical protein
VLPLSKELWQEITRNRTDRLAKQPLLPTKPYSPSWIDHFTAWLDRLPFPAWLSYVGIWLVLWMSYSAVKWRDQAYPIGTFNGLHLLLTGTSVYGVALMHYLDRSAANALAAFRPVLTVDAKGYADLEYRLTTLPAWPTLWATILVGLWRGPFFLYHRDMFAHFKLGTSGVTLVLEIVLFCFMWGVVGAFVYHTFHQLRTVSHIYRQRTRINLFQLGPLYAFSQLTAQTALGIICASAVWVFAERFTGYPLVLSETTIFLSLVAVVTFLWPLRHAHAILAAEKQRLQDETAHRLATTFAQLEHRLDADDLATVSELKTVIDSLRTKQEVVGNISTWPWQTDTVRWVATAAALPLVLWLIQRLLEQLFFAP